MSTTFNDTRTDAIPVVKPEERPSIPRFIRKFAVPIIIGWIALIALLSMIVPDLDEVGKMRSVSMAPTMRNRWSRQSAWARYSTSTSPTAR